MLKQNHRQFISQLILAIALYPVMESLNYFGIAKDPWLVGFVVGIMCSWILVAIIVHWKHRPKWISWLVPVQLAAGSAKIDLREMVLANTWMMCHNQDHGRFKEIEFLEGGRIGKGYGRYQASWELIETMLVFRRDDGTVNNRFLWNQDVGQFDSTNEKESRTVGEMRVRGQYLKPIV